jgi:hypothetical protein
MVISYRCFGMTYHYKMKIFRDLYFIICSYEFLWHNSLSTIYLYFLHLFIRLINLVKLAPNYY